MLELPSIKFYPLEFHRSVPHTSIAVVCMVDGFYDISHEEDSKMNSNRNDPNSKCSINIILFIPISMHLNPIPKA